MSDIIDRLAVTNKEKVHDRNRCLRRLYLNGVDEGRLLTTLRKPVTGGPDHQIRSQVMGISLGSTLCCKETGERSWQLRSMAHNE